MLAWPRMERSVARSPPLRRKRVAKVCLRTCGVTFLLPAIPARNSNVAQRQPLRTPAVTLHRRRQPAQLPSRQRRYRLLHLAHALDFQPPPAEAGQALEGRKAHVDGGGRELLHRGEIAPLS